MSPRRCAVLTMADTAGHAIDDHLAVAPLARLGVDVEELPWDRSEVDWDRYERVVVRSTWDYMERSEEFLGVLGVIDGSRAELRNSLELMRWNLNKGYLRDLEQRGIETIPTLWRERLEPGGLPTLMDELKSERIVVKQQVGAGALGSWRLGRADLEARAAEVEAHYRARPLLAQPFVSSVVSEGEYSLIYFGGELSHVLSKTPREGDYRSQEEYGSQLRAVVPDAELRGVGARVLAALPEAPLYARVDLLRAEGGRGFWLIELELVEPSLYLRMDAGAPERFARAVAGA